MPQNTNNLFTNQSNLNHHIFALISTEGCQDEITEYNMKINLVCHVIDQIFP